MKLYVNTVTRPSFNLALEEYLLTKTGEELAMLWRNEKSVIVGRNQNTAGEVDSGFCREHEIAVVRRISGGGAVFHDLGNINFTVIHKAGENDFSNYEKFTSPIVEFLRGKGVSAGLDGRNDLVIDGMKFSGNAQAVRRGRILHHGTILYSADFSGLAGALRPAKAKFESKGIKSVRARVTNVVDHLADAPPAEKFLSELAVFFKERSPYRAPFTLDGKAEAEVLALEKEKYSTWEWNFGQSPAYNYSKSRKFPFGFVEVCLSVEGGTIRKARIFGDYFGVGEISGLESTLEGVRHDREHVAAALMKTRIGDYIHGAEAEDILSLF